MATEGPLVHDGSQTTAAADLSTGLGGQGGSGQFLAVKITAARQVNICTTGDYAYGILQNKPASGQAADVGIMGVSKAVCGGTVSAGDYLTPNTSGQLITATTTAQPRIAVAIEAATGVSTVFTVAIVPGETTRSVV